MEWIPTSGQACSIANIKSHFEYIVEFINRGRLRREIVREESYITLVLVRIFLYPFLFYRTTTLVFGIGLGIRPTILHFICQYKCMHNDFSLTQEFPEIWIVGR